MRLSRWGLRPQTPGSQWGLRPRTLGVVLLTCAAALAAVPPAFAQSKKPPAKVDPKLAEAKRLFDDGAEAYAKGNYEEAIKAWDLAYDLSQKPLIFDSLANAWERLGDAKKSRDYLSKWRDAAPAEERATLDARIRNLDARITRDEEAARQAAADKAAREARERAAIEASKQKPWLPGAIVTGAGGVVVLAGVAVDIVATTKRPDAASCKTVGGQTLCKTSAQDGIALSNRMAIAGDITWIAGAAAAAAGVVLIIVRTRPAPRDAAPPAPAAAAYLAPAPGGVLLGGRF